MDPSAFRKLVEQAKADPEFFHNLVFAPDKALSSAKYLDKRAKQALQTINPESVVALAVGELQGCGGDYTCSCPVLAELAETHVEGSLQRYMQWG